ncbi:DNA topoisomerase [Lachnospiraceae bacterium ZAX-1]
MAKALYIAEKPSVAREFAKALKFNMTRCDGYLESKEAVVTWCVGHLVTMSYPEAYDLKYKRWSLSTLPFLPEEFKYEIIPSVGKQYKIVSNLLNRPDIDTIYVCTDSGREGEYIYRLVEQMANVIGKQRRRVWIDSQTEEEILRGIAQAKDLSEYDNLSESAYLRAKEDYLMGINFSRLLTLKYGQAISNFMKTKYTVVSVGRVMTCVLGMVVRREREIRGFVKTPFYRVLSTICMDSQKNMDGQAAMDNQKNVDSQKRENSQEIEGEWRALKGSAYFESPKLYKENGFLKEKDAKALVDLLSNPTPIKATIVAVEKKKENKNPPLLYNLAELQNDCSKLFKMSPDETLRIVQELYEKKLVTYPRTDARVLSTAVAKEIEKNIGGLLNIPMVSSYAEEILSTGSYKDIAKTRYVNDKQITDHYAIIPTGQGMGARKGLSSHASYIYEAIVRRFLSIFYPPAVYQKIGLTTKIQEEMFFSSFKTLISPGYLKLTTYSFLTKKEPEGTKSMEKKKEPEAAESTIIKKEPEDTGNLYDQAFAMQLSKLKKGMELQIKALTIKEGETSPPKRYHSGSIILAMENAGQLIEDEELRAQIKGSGIGTSATRAEILKKLVNNNYLALNKKTQTIIPTLLGEIIYDVVNESIKSLLNPELTASWEKGLTYVAEGTISTREYMVKLEHFIKSRTSGVVKLNNQYVLQNYFKAAAINYKKK